MQDDKFWYCLVGTNDVNTGMLRFIIAVSAFVVVFALIFWALAA